MLTRSLLVLALVETGCISSGLSQCKNGRICAEGLRCDDTLDMCVSVAPVTCGDGAIAVEEECDDGNRLSHDGCSSVCKLESPTWKLLGMSAEATRTARAIAYDPLRGRVVVFGGQGMTGVDLADTREWDGTSWVRPSSIGAEPMPRSGAKMAFDAARGRIILYGGSSNATTYLNDTWGWDGANWTMLTTTPQPARIGVALAEDITRKRILKFGGYATGYTDETYEWNGVDWTLLVPASSPPQRGYHAMSFDARRERIVMFGGTNLPAPQLTDTWEWDGTSWVDARSAGPPPRTGHAMAYDGGGRTILFGGTDALTWEWNGSTWTSNPLPAPALRIGHAMAYDAIHQYIVLVGGVQSSPSTWFMDTWTFRYEHAGEIDESCIAGEDADGDGLAACDDADCWSRCTPLCAPGATDCDPLAPHCGDDDCNEALEQSVCPADCP